MCLRQAILASSLSYFLFYNYPSAILPKKGLSLPYPESHHVPQLSRVPSNGAIWKTDIRETFFNESSDSNTTPINVYDIVYNIV